jgi:rhamnosyltransferase
MAADKILVSVAILTYNGEEYLGEVLQAVSKQKTNFSYEVLVIDSGSSDSTLQIVAKHQKRLKNFRLQSIGKKEFGHGCTRNLAVKLARGEFVAFLTQDATPAHPYWLENIVKPFEISSRVVGVVGKQIPRLGCPPIIKQDIIGTFNNQGVAQGITLYERGARLKSGYDTDITTFYSDSNSALRKSWRERPYRNVSYAEDQAFGRDIIAAGMIKAYAPSASVLHSHQYSIAEYRKRIFEEFDGLRRLEVEIPIIGRKAVVKLTLKGTLRDWKYVLRNREYRIGERLRWVCLSPGYNVARWYSVWLAGQGRVRSLPKQ